MKKLLLCCKKTFQKESEILFEFGKEYIGLLTDDEVILTILGETGHELIFKSELGEKVEPRPYYYSSEYGEHFIRMRQLEPMVSIEIEVYKPSPDKLGYVQVDRRRTIGEVLADIKQALLEQQLWPELDYFNISTYASLRNNDIESKPFPEYHWIGVYPVKGGSEGYYFHIDVINGDKRELLYLGKTLSEDIEVALKINNVLLRLFQ